MMLFSALVAGMSLLALLQVVCGPTQRVAAQVLGPSALNQVTVSCTGPPGSGGALRQQVASFTTYTLVDCSQRVMFFVNNNISIPKSSVIEFVTFAVRGGTVLPSIVLQTLCVPLRNITLRVTGVSVSSADGLPRSLTEPLLHLFANHIGCGSKSDTAIAGVAVDIDTVQIRAVAASSPPPGNPSLLLWTTDAMIRLYTQGAQVSDVSLSLYRVHVAARLTWAFFTILGEGVVEADLVRVAWVSQHCTWDLKFTDKSGGLVYLGASRDISDVRVLVSEDVGFFDYENMEKATDVSVCLCQVTRVLRDVHIVVTATRWVSVVRFDVDDTYAERQLFLIEFTGFDFNKFLELYRIRVDILNETAMAANCSGLVGAVEFDSCVVGDDMQVYISNGATFDMNGYGNVASSITIRSVAVVVYNNLRRATNVVLSASDTVAFLYSQSGITRDDPSVPQMLLQVTAQYVIVSGEIQGFVANLTNCTIHARITDGYFVRGPSLLFAFGCTSASFVQFDKRYPVSDVAVRVTHSTLSSVVDFAVNPNFVGFPFTKSGLYSTSTCVVSFVVNCTRCSLFLSDVAVRPSFGAFRGIDLHPQRAPVSCTAVNRLNTTSIVFSYDVFRVLSTCGIQQALVGNLSSTIQPFLSPVLVDNVRVDVVRCRIDFYNRLVDDDIHQTTTALPSVRYTAAGPLDTVCVVAIGSMWSHVVVNIASVPPPVYIPSSERPEGLGDLFACQDSCAVAHGVVTINGDGLGPSVVPAMAFVLAGAPPLSTSELTIGFRSVYRAAYLTTSLQNISFLITNGVAFGSSFVSTPHGMIAVEPSSALTVQKLSVVSRGVAFVRQTGGCVSPAVKPVIASERKGTEPAARIVFGCTLLDGAPVVSALPSGFVLMVSASSSNPPPLASVLSVSFDCPAVALLPSDTKAAVSAVVAVTSALSLFPSVAQASPKGVGSLQSAARVLGLRRRCTLMEGRDPDASDADDDGAYAEPSSNAILDNPLQLHLDDTFGYAFGHSAGALIGNSVLLLLVVIVLAALMALRTAVDRAVRRPSTTRNERQLVPVALLALPDSALPASMPSPLDAAPVFNALLQPTCAASAILLAGMAGSGAAVAAASLAVTFWAAVPLAVGLAAVVYPFPFEGVANAKYLALTQLLDGTHTSSSGTRVSMKKKGALYLQLLLLRQEDWVVTSCAAPTRTKKSPGHLLGGLSSQSATAVHSGASRSPQAVASVERLKCLYDGFRGGFYWFFLAEWAVAISCGVLIGMADGAAVASDASSADYTSSDCHTTASSISWAVFGINTALAAVYAVARPYTSLLDNLMATVVTSFASASLALSLAEQDGIAAHLDTTAAIISIAPMVPVFAHKLLSFATSWFHWTDRMVERQTKQRLLSALSQAHVAALSALREALSGISGGLGMVEGCDVLKNPNEVLGGIVRAICCRRRERQRTAEDALFFT